MWHSLYFVVFSACTRLVACHSQAVLGLVPNPELTLSALSSFSNLSEVEISGSPFSGLTTFANLPYADCFSDDSDVSPYDIAFVGAPFDTGVSSRPGARFGPRGIRAGSIRINADFAYDILTGYNPFKDWAKIVDCGDVPMTPFDNRYALRQLEKGHRLVSGRQRASELEAVGKSKDEDSSKGKSKSHPRIITLGGDHTITLAALRSTYDRWGKVSVIHFDSHIDTWDPKVLGGGISDYSAVNHGTFLHIAYEEGLIADDTSMHAGIRAPVARRHGDVRNDLRCGFEIVHARAVDSYGIHGVVEKIKSRVGDTRVYISVDIDVLDPAFAPATGTPEVGGWTTRELLAVLEGLQGLKVIGADVVEVAPVYDTAGETTGLAAAEVALKLMELMVRKQM